ncbi:MAG: wax ester/triacylglycerol synthase family O-acyltransferase [Acidimicrobiales bacterium]
MTITPAKHDKPRTIESSDRMTEHEALMWNVEKDPWLNPSGAALVLLDKPLDMAAFRQVMRNAVAHIPRFRQRGPRVRPNLHTRLGTRRRVRPRPPSAAHHPARRWLRTRTVRPGHSALPGTARPHPPLWRFVAIDGLESGGGALWMLTHHAVADGIGQIRLSELYQSLSPDDPLPPEVDLEQIIADDVAAYEEKEAGGDLATDLRTTVTRSTTHLVRRQLGLTRRFAAEVAMWPADPTRANERLDELAATARSSVGQLVNTGGEATSGSPLWKELRHRHLEHVRVPLDQLKAAAKRHDATINDAFLTGMVEAVVRYHGTHDTPLSSRSTPRSCSAPAKAPAPAALVRARAGPSVGPRDVHHRPPRRCQAAHRPSKDDATKGGGVTILSGVVNLLPTSVITRAARAQASKLDLATSNLRSAPFPVYVVGSRVMGTVTMGPLAGTPCNATAMSSENNFDIGLFIDPTAIDDPAEFRRHVAESFADLLATL